MKTRMPRLLDASLQERARLNPVRLSMDLQLSPLSTAEMLLPASDPEVHVRELVELYDEKGSVGIFRVTEIDTEPGLCRTVYLEHGLATLSDSIVPPTSFTGTAREALSMLLAHQSDVHWQLGEVGVPEEAIVLFTCGCSNLLTALLQLVELLPDGLMLVFDQRTHPWTLHLQQMSSEPVCEGRLNRSLSSVRIVTDASSLCTRVYPYGAGQGTERISLTPLTGQDWLESEAAQVWGRISRTFTAGNIFDVPTLKAVAEKYLALHSTPTVSITAEGTELAAVTGEPADAFRLGDVCRLALPDHDVMLAERIVALHRPDLITQPLRVTVTLCSRMPDASDEIADMLREVTASRIIGGRVSDVSSTNRAEGTAASRIEHHFRVEDWAAVLACQVAFDADEGVRVVGVSVDNNAVSDLVYADGRFDALPYLRRDELGVITPGRHTLAIYPDNGAVNSTVKLKVIEKI